MDMGRLCSKKVICACVGVGCERSWEFEFSRDFEMWPVVSVSLVFRHACRVGKTWLLGCVGHV